MKPTDNLHQLIKSLTSSEKRYFKVFAKRHVVGLQNKYEQLFDVYDGLPDDHYDEPELKQKLKKKNLGKNLADDKKNLQEMIMRAMLSFHSGNSIDTQLNDLLAEEDFYRQKRLNDLRRKTITKAKEIAEKYEKYSVLLTLIDREVNMKVELNQNELSDLAKNLDIEKNKVLEKLNTIAVLRNINQWFFIHFRLNANNASEKFKSDADAKLNLPIIKNYIVGLCYAADSNYLKVWSLYHQMKKDYEKHNIYSKQIYELFEKYEVQKDANRVSYKIAAYNYLTSLHQINNYPAMGEILNSLDKIKPLTEDEAGEDFQNVIFYKQIYYMNVGKFKDATNLIADFEDGLKRHRKKINKARELSIYFNITTNFLIQEQWDSVINYSNKILDDDTNVRRDLKYNSMLIQLLAYYESNQFDLLLYKIRNTERLLKKNDAFDESHQYFIKVLNQLLKHGKQYFKTHSVEIEPIISNLSKHKELQIWLQSRYRKVTMMELLKE